MALLILSALLTGCCAGWIAPSAARVAGDLCRRAERWVDERRALLFASFSPRRLVRAQIALALPLLAAGVAARSLVLGVAALAVVIGPPLVLVRAVTARRHRLDAQLDRTVSDLADALRTSGSIPEALRRVASHAMPPISQEIDLVLGEARLGVDLASALDGLVERSGSLAAASMAMAIAIGRRTGGDLPRILEAMAETLREQKRLEGVLRSKTAEGRGQAWVLGAIPPALVGYLGFSNPEWMCPLWSDPVGWILLGVAALLEVAAVVMVRRLVTFTG